MKAQIFIIAIASLLASDLASAVCLDGNPSIVQEYSASQSVFIGKVMGKKHVSESHDYYDGDEYKVQVQDIFKGKATNPIIIFSENSSGRFPLTEGSIYLIFVYNELGRYQINNCGNSGLLSAKKDAVLEVQKLKPFEQ